ncbi:MAG: metal ABC transporter permease [Rhodospirillales bacterium]
MISEFILHAALAGIGVAIIAAPLGCFVVWRRMAYFGDTMAHSALLGAAAAIAFDIDATLGVFTVAVLVALALLALERRGGLATDTLLGLLSHSALAVGLVVMGFMAGLRLDLFGYLFGDILAVNTYDLALIWGGGAVILAILIRIWRPLLAATVAPDVAAAEGMNPHRHRLIFMLLLAGVIAIAMKIVGILLITALLIIPAATARRLAATPEAMAGIAAIAGSLAVIGGLWAAMTADTPAGPTIVVAALVLFLAGTVTWKRKAVDHG